MNDKRKTWFLLSLTTMVLIVSLGLFASAQESERGELHGPVVFDESVDAAHDPVGLTLLKLGKYQEAADYYRQVLARDPESMEARLALGTALCGLGQTDEALQELNRCIQVPLRQEAFMARGQCYHLMGGEYLDRAEDDYKKVLEIMPDNHSAHNQLGLIYQTRGEHTAAVAEFQSAIALTPDAFEAYNNQAASLLALGRYREAITLIQEAIKKKPDLANVHLYNNLGLAFLHAAKLGEAEAAFLMETAINPGYLDAHLNLGNLYAISKREDEAIYEYHRVLLADPDHREALVNLGAILVRLGKHQAALTHLNQAIALYPDHALAYHYKSLAMEELGSLERAAAIARKAKELGYKEGATPWPKLKKPTGAIP